MIDFHSHILPNIDDGAESLEETIELLKEAWEAGFTKIISTSHYIEKYYESSEEKRTQVLNEALVLAKEKLGDNIPELYIGSEIYITNEIIELIEQKKASTINNSRYVLFELPMNIKPLFAKGIIYKLIEDGYKPIIAHPERYTYVQNDISFAKELAEMGALFQLNYGSIIGIYGNKAKKAAKELIKENLVQFLGSDVHKKKSIYKKMPKIMKKLEKLVGKEKLGELTNINPENVLNNLDL